MAAEGSRSATEGLPKADREEDTAAAPGEFRAQANTQAKAKPPAAQTPQGERLPVAQIQWLEAREEVVPERQESRARTIQAEPRAAGALAVRWVAPLGLVRRE